MTFDPSRPRVGDAAAVGIPALDQRDRLRAAASLCGELAAEIRPHEKSSEAWAYCQALNRAADWMGQHADAIDAGIAASGEKPHDFPPGQKAVDKVYGREWAANFGKTREEMLDRGEELAQQIRDEGMMPSLRAKMRAVTDVMNENGYNPPILDESLNRPPLALPAEEPDLGDS